VSSAARRSVLQTLTDRLVNLRLDHPARVGIDGVTASGKTTLANELAGLLQASGCPVLRVSLDDFHHPESERYRRGHDSPEGYYHDAFDYPRFVESVLRPLGPGGDGHVLIGDLRQALTLDAILIVDGVFLFRPELDAYWDYRVFVQVDPAIALQRAIYRDSSWMGGELAARRRFAARYVPGERLYLDAVHPETKADALFENSDPQSPRLTLG
jgi:uridine kinase